MLTVESTILVVVDVQGKLATLMHEHETFFSKLETLVRSAHLLEIPVLPVEQIPEKLGKTIPQIYPYLEEPIIAKTSFSAMGDASFAAALAEQKRKHILLTGIEAHICVYQTAKDLIANGYEVSLVSDAIASRDDRNKLLAIDNLKQLGVGITCLEMLLFELMKDAKHPKFREIQKIIK